MRDPVTRCRGSLWVFPCEKIRAVLRLLIISNKFVRQSRHIGTLTKMVFVVWVGFSPHLLQDLFVCNHWPPGRGPRFASQPKWSQTGKVNSSVSHLLAFQPTLFQIPEDLCSCMTENISELLKKELRTWCWKLLLWATYEVQLSQMVKKHIESHFMSLKNKREETRQKDVVLKYFLCFCAEVTTAGPWK